MTKKIVLFDMDGTLTEPRQKFDETILGDSLYFLTNSGIDIGIVTGSGLEYLREQMGAWLDESACRYSTHLFPCNGTQYLKPPKRKTESHQLVHSVSMEQQIGSENYRELIKELIGMQYDMADRPIPLSGHFIDYRDSMINWCPIGRDATFEKRNKFVELDSKLNLRIDQLIELNNQIEALGLKSLVSVKLGGDTSFDIYPRGWDKTYALAHLQDYEVWFVGDRCEPSGNDYELYKHCGAQGFKSSGPASTKEIIDNISKKIGTNYV